MTGMTTGPKQRKCDKRARQPAFAPGWQRSLAAVLVGACGAQVHAASVSALAAATVLEPAAITTQVGPASAYSGGMTRVIVLNAAQGSAPAVRPQPDTALVTVVSERHTYSVTAIATEAMGQTIAAQTLPPAPSAAAGTILAGKMMVAGVAYGRSAGPGDIIVMIDYN